MVTVWWLIDVGDVFHVAKHIFSPTSVTNIDVTKWINKFILKLINLWPKKYSWNYYQSMKIFSPWIVSRVHCLILFWAEKVQAVTKRLKTLLVSNAKKVSLCPRHQCGLENMYFELSSLQRPSAKQFQGFSNMISIEMSIIRARRTSF